MCKSVFLRNKIIIPREHISLFMNFPADLPKMLMHGNINIIKFLVVECIAILHGWQKNWSLVVPSPKSQHFSWYWRIFLYIWLTHHVFIMAGLNLLTSTYPTPHKSGVSWIQNVFYILKVSYSFCRIIFYPDPVFMHRISSYR